MSVHEAGNFPVENTYLFLKKGEQKKVENYNQS